MELLRHIGIALAYPDDDIYIYALHTLRYGCEERRNTTKEREILVVCLNITREVNVSCFRSLIFFT